MSDTIVLKRELTISEDELRKYYDEYVDADVAPDFKDVKDELVKLLENAWTDSYEDLQQTVIDEAIVQGYDSGQITDREE